MRATQRISPPPPRASLVVPKAAVAAAPAPTKCVAIVTGGAGFIGAHLALALARDARFAAVVAVDDFDAHGPYPRAWKRANANALRASGVRVETSDASDADAFARVVRVAAGDDEDAEIRIAHLAARSGVGAAAGDAVGATRANALSAAAVLSVASRANRERRGARRARVARVVLASSGSVYGEASMTADGAPRASRVGDRTDDPTSTYAATKRSSELLAKAHVATQRDVARESRVSVVVARIFTVFGPRGRPDMAVWRFIQQLTSGARLTRFGDGQSTWRDYVYVDDVVDALTRALTVELPETSEGFEIVNVAGARPVFLSEIIAACEEACGTSSAVDELPQRPGDVGGTYGDITEATALLDWTPKTTLRDGLRRTVAWWRSSEADEYRDASL